MDYDEWQKICKAFKKEEMKTKHLKRTAEKRKKTRSIKISDAKSLESVKENLRRRIESVTSDTLRRIASHSKTASEINKYRGQIRQILS